MKIYQKSYDDYEIKNNVYIDSILKLFCFNHKSKYLKYQIIIMFAIYNVKFSYKYWEHKKEKINNFHVIKQDDSFKD